VPKKKSPHNSRQNLNKFRHNFLIFNTNIPILQFTEKFGNFAQHCKFATSLHGDNVIFEVIKNAISDKDGCLIKALQKENRSLVKRISQQKSTEVMSRD